LARHLAAIDQNQGELRGRPRLAGQGLSDGVGAVGRGCRPRHPLAELHNRIEAAYWATLDEATSPAEGEARLRRLVTDLERQYPSSAACLAEDLPALCVHLAYPLRLRKRLRSTNLLERSLEEVKRRTKVIGRFRGETSCLNLAWAVLDLFIASARGLALTALEHRQLAQMGAARMAQTPESLTA
jgi:transposase-like protein